MARQQATKIANQFINGLITENTALSFPEEAAVETFDCVFDRTGRVTRRDAFDVEAASSLTSIGHVDGDYIAEYLWETVGGVGAKSFLVLQTSNILRFYDVSTSTGITANVESFTLDLDSVIPAGSSLDPAVKFCQFTAGNGDLLVTNPATNPFYVTYDATLDAVTMNTITLKYRDFAGVDDGLTLNERVTSTLANLATSNASHYYNIVNQGWFDEVTTQWDAARTDMPSNSDIMSTTRASATDSFQNAQVTSSTSNNSTEAPKGHFILSVFAPDRVEACNAEAGDTIAASGAADTAIDDGDGTIVTDLDTNPSRAFDGTSFLSASSSGSISTYYCGKNFGASDKRKIGSADITADFFNTFISGSNPTITVVLRGSNTLPVDWAADGSSLGTDNATDAANLKLSVDSTDAATSWQWVWFNVTVSSGSGTMYCGEIDLFASAGQAEESLDVDDMSTTERPTSIAFYASRAWYAGTNERRRSANIYYSQLIVNRDQFGKCYQQNDPTNEDVFDLVATDGGVINIPEIGSVKTMFTYQDSLLIFSNKGIWQVSGGLKGFAATEFKVRKISSVGMAGPASIVDVKGVPVFWADQGIYSVIYDFENDSFQAKSLTDDKIKTFITDIPEYNRQWVKGAYNIQKEIITFIYNDSTTLATDNTEFKYTKILNLDTRTGAFYPWTIGDNTLDIRGIVYIRTGDRSAASIVKLLCFENVDGTNEKIGFANQVSGQLLDWTQYAIDTATASEQIDYTSYFESGYLVHAEAIKYFQATYINVFMEVETYAGLRMKGIFDFSNSTSSNKEGTLQQCYNDLGNIQLSFRDVSMRKLKIRGKGRSLSLRFESESERPFTLIGWALYETANAQV